MVLWLPLLLKLRFQHKHPSPSCSSKKSSKKGFRECKSEEDILPWWKEYGSKLHYRISLLIPFCYICTTRTILLDSPAQLDMYPIVGDRYRCQDCVEEIGFDLCGDCYKTSSKHPGRFNQQRTPDHKFKHVMPMELSAGFMFQLVGHIVDSSGAPVLAISALEHSSDGWIAVDSADVPQGTEDNSVFPDGDRDSNMLDDNPEGSVPVNYSDGPEFSDALESAGDCVDSRGRHDSDMEDRGEESPSTTA